MNLLERGNQDTGKGQAPRRPEPERDVETDGSSGTEAFGSEENTREPDDMEELDLTDVPLRPKHSQNQSMTAILLGVIVVLLIAVFVLLFLLSTRKQEVRTDSQEALQQSITDYANQQKENDKTAESAANEAVVVAPSNADAQETQPEETQPAQEEGDYVVESEAVDKTAVIVDIEDENDVAYTKEFILNEMEPYFADNNLDAVWDLAHLKRYVKLSAELKNTNSYYYLGDVDDAGKPDGIGLAIYEKNTYYYGSWVHGMREGNGRWYRFYIDEIGSRTTRKKYQAHSYAGAWRNDLPNGDGAEHYDVDISQLEPYERVIQNVIGNFTDGLYDGELYANSVNYQGTVEEWSGTARNGVFDLWRDMSSIGECSVWQNKMDENSWMDIDQSENKNQGMRELLKITPAK